MKNTKRVKSIYEKPLSMEEVKQIRERSKAVLNRIGMVTIPFNGFKKKETA